MTSDVMSLTNLAQVINNIQGQPGWQQHRQLLLIIERWSGVVGDLVAQHTRPTGIYRQVLQVAVSSAVWSQNLVFERQRILVKLNALLVGSTSPMLDIHFSTAKWTINKKETVLPQPSEQIKQHPSYIQELAKGSREVPAAIPKDALEAFKRWSAVIKTNAAHLPKCSRCNCPTPKGELERWKMCRNCFSDRQSLT